MENLTLSDIELFCKHIGMTEADTSNLLPGEQVEHLESKDYEHFFQLLCRRSVPYAKLLADRDELLSALKCANSLLAELSFTDWIPKTSAPNIDIRQRIRATHFKASDAITKAEGQS